MRSASQEVRIEMEEDMNKGEVTSGDKSPRSTVNTKSIEKQQSRVTIAITVAIISFIQRSAKK